MKNFLNKFLPIARIARNRKIIPLVDLFLGEKVLDTSCGNGTFLQTLSKVNSSKGCEFYGIDYDRESIEQASLNFPAANLIVSKNEEIPFSEKSFDLVISAMTLHHMRDIKSSLLEMKRVCKEEGRIVLVDAVSFNKLSRVILKLSGKCPEPYYFEKFYSDKELEVIFNELGLRVTKKSAFYVFPGLGIIMPVCFFELRASD